MCRPPGSAGDDHATGPGCRRQPEAVSVADSSTVTAGADILEESLAPAADVRYRWRRQRLVRLPALREEDIDGTAGHHAGRGRSRPGTGVLSGAGLAARRGGYGRRRLFPRQGEWRSPCGTGLVSPRTARSATAAGGRVTLAHNVGRCAAQVPCFQLALVVSGKIGIPGGPRSPAGSLFPRNLILRRACLEDVGLPQPCTRNSAHPCTRIFSSFFLAQCHQGPFCQR